MEISGTQGNHGVGGAAKVVGSKSILEKGLSRLYLDACPTDRLPDYYDLLQAVLAAGFQVESLYSFWKKLRNCELVYGQKHLLLRHDVDVSIQAARKMWNIERKLNVISSYYFRLSTLDSGLAREMEAGGCEVGYHYEELSSLIKRSGLTRPEEALRQVPQARAEFLRNIDRFRLDVKLPVRTAASHGDFANRKLHVCNTVILEDPGFREMVGIDLEAYDEVLRCDHVFSDVTRERAPLWEPAAPNFRSGPLGSQVYLLVHPHGWSKGAPALLADDVLRVWDEMRYRCAVWLHRARL